MERRNVVGLQPSRTAASAAPPAVPLERGAADPLPPGALQRSQTHAGARLSNSLSFAFQDKSPFPIR